MGSSISSNCSPEARRYRFSASVRPDRFLRTSESSTSQCGIRLQLFRAIGQGLNHIRLRQNDLFHELPNLRLFGRSRRRHDKPVDALFAVVTEMRGNYQRHIRPRRSSSRNCRRHRGSAATRLNDGRQRIAYQRTCKKDLGFLTIRRLVATVWSCPGPQR
jgi:hypothetical protein